MKARRIIAITTQTDEAFILRRRAGSTQACCPQCGPGAPLLTPEEAAGLFQVAVRAIYRAVETEQLHFQETAAGSLLVCLGSLQKVARLLSPSSSSPIQNDKEIPS